MLLRIGETRVCRGISGCNPGCGPLATFSGTDHAARGLDLRVMRGLSRMFFFPVGRKNFLSIMCKEAPLSTMYILSFDCMIGFGSDVSSILRWESIF